MAASGEGLYGDDVSTEPSFYRADDDDAHHSSRRNKRGGGDDDGDDDSDDEEVIVFRCEACSKSFKVTRACCVVWKCVRAGLSS